MRSAVFAVIGLAVAVLVLVYLRICEVPFLQSLVIGGMCGSGIESALGRIFSTSAKL